MYEKLFFSIPNEYNVAYRKERKEKNYKNLMVVGILLPIVQLFVYLSSLTDPWTYSPSLMRLYHIFYGLSMVLMVVMAVLLFITKRRKIFDKDMLRPVIYMHTSLIMMYVAGVAVFDQLQDEDVVFYYTMLFMIAILVDLSVPEHLLILVPVQLLYIGALLSSSDRFPGLEGQINDSTQYVFMAVLVNYYINELQKKNFIQRHMLIDKNYELEYYSFYDPLSGLFNRRKWEKNYHEMFQSAKDKGLSLGVLIIDIDYFKQYNDNYGHVAGDEIIRRVSDMLLKATDGLEANVGRYGGDEFAISFQNMDEVSLKKVINTIKSGVKDLNIAHEYAEYSRQLTLSIGAYAGAVGPKQQPWDIVVEADKVLYREKENRKHRISG